MGSTNSFRPNAGVVVLDGAGQVLAFRRTGSVDAWQYPQGGIDEGESAVDAMWRELAEETGLGNDLVELVDELPEWIGYEIPDDLLAAMSEKKRKKLQRGQVQRWFFVRLRPGVGERVAEVLNELPPEEFDAWKWTSAAELAAETIAFRQPIYTRLVAYGLEKRLLS